MANLTQSQIDGAKNLSCESCGNEVMKQVFVIKTISGLLTGESKDTLIPVPLFACNSCNHINKMFSEDLKIKNISDEKILHVPV